MKLKPMMIGLVLVLTAGFDTMEQDTDRQILSINNDPAYFLPNNDGFIDLGSRMLSPGKLRVEIRQMQDGLQPFEAEGSSHTGIAAMMDITESTSRSQLHYAKSLLKEKLGGIERPNYYERPARG